MSERTGELSGSLKMTTSAIMTSLSSKSPSSSARLRDDGFDARVEAEGATEDVEDRLYVVADVGRVELGLEPCD
eukprot:2886116-Prymnesium_polylepis.1